MTIEDEMLGRPSGQTADTSLESQMLAKPPGALKKLGGRIADVGLSTLKGAIGVPESIIGMADLVTGGDAGKLAEKAGFRPKEAKAFLDPFYSDQQKAANAEVDKAEGFMPTVGAMVQNPSTILHQAVESAPSMITGGAVARGLMKVSPTLGPIGAGAMGEGAVAAGQSAEHVRQEDPNGTLTGKQAAILAASGGLTGAIGFGSGQLANKLGIGELSTMIAAGRVGAVGADAVEAGAKKGIMRKIGEGALVEGIGQELPQSYQEQVATNLAQDKPWDEGAAKAGAQGMLAGALLGGIGGPLSGKEAATNTTTAPNAPATPGTPPAPPGGPLSPAAPAGPLAAAAALVPAAPAGGPKSSLPFSTMEVAQKQADAATLATGIPHEAVDHPTVPGRFASMPAGISGADELFVKEAERQGVDASIAQLASHGPGAQQLLADVMAANPDLDPQLWRDPAMRAQLGAAYLKQNIDALGEALGHAPTPAEHYIAQLLGVPAASAMLTMPEAERSMPVSAVIADPALEDRLGVTGMPVDGALDVLTKQAAQLLATMKEKGNANLATDVPGAGSGTDRPGAGAAVGDVQRDQPVPERPAGRTDALVDAPAAGVGDAGSDAAGAGAVASPRVIVGPSETGYQNENAQRHRDTADQLGLTAKIEAHFGDGLTINQVVGQLQDLVPGMVPADVPNFVNGVRQTLGIPAPISPEGKGAFDTWRAEYKARLAQPPATPAPAAPAAVETTTPTGPTTPENQKPQSGKPRLGENADDLYRAIKQQTDKGIAPGPDGRQLTPVVRVLGIGDMKISSQGVEVLSDGGAGTRAATAAEIDTLHDELEADRAQVLGMSQWGGSTGASRPVVELHSPSGNSFAAPAAPAPTGPTTSNEDAPSRGVVAKADDDSGKANIDHARLEFVGAGGFAVSNELKAKVQEALRTRQDAYETSRYAENDTRLHMPKTEHTKNPRGGQFHVQDDGRVSLMGDDEYGWASTMSQRSVTRTLTDWLKNMGETPAPTGATTSAEAAAAAPAATSEWTYRDGTPFSPEDHDLYTRASQAFASVLAKETNDGPTPGLRREQLEEQIKNPGRYAQIDEVPNDKGLKIGDSVTRGGSDEVYTVTSITSRELNGKTKIEVHTNRPGSYGGWSGIESVNKVGVSAPTQEAAQPNKFKPPVRVDYPNRKLGFQRAASDEDAKYDDHAWANIAAANMQVGDTFKLNGKQTTVSSISDKTLVLVVAEKGGTDRKKRTLNPNGVAWAQFQRDLGGQLTAENLQAKNIMKPKRPLIDILKRDPAVHVDENGSVYLKDGGLVQVNDAVEEKDTATRSDRIITTPTLAELKEGANLVMASPFFRVRGAYMKPVEVYDSGRVQATLYNLATGKPRRGDGHGKHGIDFVVRDGVLYEASPNWGHEGGTSVLEAEVELLDKLPASDNTAAPEADQDAAIPPRSKIGTVDDPIKFYSGMSRPGDFTKLFAAHRNVGITVSELSKVSTSAIARAMADSNAHLFVDSGAFPIYKRNERAFLNALSKNHVDEIKGEEVLSFDQILARYEAIRDAINEADESGEAVERAYFVMPDVVGNQAESLRLVGQYASQIKAMGVHNAIVPLQVGELSLTKAYESMMLELGYDPDTTPGPIIGIPSNAAAAPNDQLTALLEKHGGNIMGVHILGAVSDARLGPRLAAIRAAGYDGHVSADANRLRALMYGETTRGEAWDELMAESAPTAGRIDTNEAWKATPFAARIQAMLDQLAAAGDPDYGKAIAGGSEMDAKVGKLDETKTAFREDNVRKHIAALATKDQPPVPVAIEPMTNEQFTELTNVAPALPKPIIDAAVARWNALAPLLAAEGFRFGEVNGSHPRPAQDAQEPMTRIIHALNGLAARRYQQAKGYKKLAPDAVSRDEKAASEHLGINTLDHPGIDISRPITLNTGRAPAKEAGTPDAEVSRFSGKYGKGMSQANATMAAHNRAKADPANDYTVEERDDGRFDVVGRMKVAAAPVRAVEESAEDKSHREWAENYQAVINDIEGASDKNILRAVGYASKAIAGYQPRAFAGDEAAKSMIRSLQTEVSFLESTLKARAPAQDAKAPVRRAGDDQLTTQVLAWGYTDDNMPKGGAGGGIPLSMPGAITAYEFDNKRSGKEQISYTITAVQGPNGQWGASVKYALGGSTEESAKGGSSFIDWDAAQYPSRKEAALAAFESMKAKVSADYSSALNNSLKPYLAREVYNAKRAALPDAKLRFAKGFATMEQELARIPLMYAVWNAQESLGKDRQKEMNKAVTALAKLPQGRLTLDGAMHLMESSPVPGQFKPNERSKFLLAPEYISSWVENRTTADLDAAYAEYERFAQGKPLLSREYFAHVLAEQTKAAKPGLKKMQDAKAAKTQEDADSAMFDDLLAEGMAERGLVAPEPAPAPAAPRTAGQAGASAVKNLAQGLGDAIDGLGKLFGGNSTFGSGPVFNDETYAKAKPLFDSAVAHLADAGTDLQEMMRTIINMVLDKFGAGPANAMKPYVLRYIADKRNDVAQQVGSDNTDNADNTKDDNGTGPAISDLGTPGVGETGREVAAGKQTREGLAGPLANPPAADDGAAGEVPGGRAAGARPPGPQVSGAESESGGGDGANGRNGTGGTGLVDAGTGVGGPAAGPARANYHIGDPEQLIGGTPKVRFANNRRAIEAYRSITEEGRAPVKADLDAMASYIGWGSFGQELFQGNWNNAKPKDGWTTEDAWLRNHLGKEEWESAQRSIINAHYTDPVTVNTMWDMVRALGFTGGRVLEPSMGIGNFFAMMPLDLAENSQLTGIELDTLTGGMAKELYPNANIQIKPYEDSKTADGFYDLVIGNWPFAKDGPSDRRYMKLNPSLHDFFFLKALDQTRPGGLVVGITSAGTMDKKGRATRMEIAKKGELVAAFRLPSGAFEKYAGTAVVTDIIVLRKRAAPLAHLADEPWIELGETKSPAGEKFEVNSYYLNHPDHVLGTLNYGHGTTYGRPAMIVDRPANLMERLGQLAAKMPAGTYLPPVDRKQVSYLTNNTADREGSATLANGKLYVVRGERLVPLADEIKYRVKDAAETARREAQIGKLIGLRNAYGALVVAERAGEENAEALRKELKRQYTAFTKAYGTLEASDGLRLLENLKDPYYYALASLEINGKPARILSEATIRGRKTMTNPSVRDAFVMARNESMNVDLASVAKLTGKTEAAVAAELEKADAIFKTPAGNYEVADIYLSGNVRRKLREAQDAQANGDTGTDFARNIAALEKVVPKTVPYFKIEAKLGAPWIKAEHYQHFVSRLLGLTRAEDEAAIDVRMVNGSWKVKFTHPSLNNRPEAKAQWGTVWDAAKLDKMLTAAMNNRSITIKYKDANGAMVVDDAATKEVSEKLVRLREEFGNWVWKDAERRVWLEENYNEVMNAVATASFDGAFLDFNGMALRRGDDPFSLREHQVNAIWRGLVNGRGLYAHEVGTGKTFTMAGLAVESRRYGLAKKPLILAHNANSATVAKEFNDMYPAARVLYLDNLTPDQIDVRMRQIANDDWDAIVVPHSLISRFALTEKTLMEISAEDIAAMEQEALDAASEDNTALTLDMMDDEEAMKKVRSATAKELVKSRNKIIKSIKDMALKSTKEGAVSFEDLGIDMVIVDEAHEFKKPPVATKMKMRGLNTGTSNMSISLRFLTDYVKRENNGRGVHLFTGTPITNTLTELYNMMRYVMDDVMARDGIKDWDSWFNTFADSSTDVELTAAGEYEAVTRLASFVNTAELRRISGEFMDIVFADDMPEFVPRPTKSGKTMNDVLTNSERNELLNGRNENPVGRPYKKIIVDVAPLGDQQKVMLDKFKALAKLFKNASKKGRREMMQSGHPASPLLVETGASNAGMDPRLVDLDGADEPNSKVNRVVRNATALYKQDKLATQVVFLERGFADEGTKTKTMKDGTKVTTKVKKFNLVKDMVAKLVAAGVKPSEIAIVDGSTSKEKRKDIADAMNKSKIRIVIGNTKTLGVGVNMQVNLRAMHHMDAPWMPGELEQRNGRGWRQGNKWNTVLEYRYITERLDGRRWQVLAVKDRFIKAFLKADENTRIIDGDAVDMNEGDDAAGDLSSTLSEAAGDPRVLVREKLKADVEKLENRERQHTYALKDAADMVRRLAGNNEQMEKKLPLLLADSAQFEAARANFSAIIGGKEYDNRPDADEALDALVAAMPENQKQLAAGTMHGFPLTLRRGGFSLAPPYVEIHGKQDFEAMTASVSSVEAAMRKLAKTAAANEQQIDDNKASIERMAAMQDEPFGQAALMAKKIKMLADLKRDLANNPEPAPAWLRHGAPANTLIYVNGQPRVVEGHKSVKGEYALVTEDGDVPYLDAKDASGMPVFEPADKQLSSEHVVPELVLTGDSTEPTRLQRRADDRLRRHADPLFSRADGGASMPVMRVRHLATSIAKGWANAPAVTVVQHAKELPFKAPQDARGAFHQGRVWLVADNLHSVAEAQFVLGHEALGHLGLRAIMEPRALANEMNRLRMINPALATAAREQAAKYGYDLTLATEEVLADMAGAGATIKGWQKFIHAVQQALRAIGLDSLANWMESHTAAETMTLLQRARGAIEGAAPARQAPASPAAQFSDGAPTSWYSALSRQIGKTVTKSASPKHWAETIMGTSFAQQGVKQDEIQWSGVLDWLLMKAEAGVTKVGREELLNYLATDGVRVTERMLGAPAPASEAGIALRKAVFDQYQPRIEDARARAEDYSLPSIEHDEARDELEELFTARDREADEAYRLPADLAEDAKYEKWQLPGGANYHELLLTLPQKEIRTADFLTLDKKGKPFGVHNTEEEAQRIASSIGGTYEASESVSWERPKFLTGHWEEPNVLAHVRFNERTDAEGKRVLFVEELQSDWGAAGRRRGFAVPKATQDELRAAADVVNDADSTLDAAKSLRDKYAGDVKYWTEKLVAVGRDPRTKPDVIATVDASLIAARARLDDQEVATKAASDSLLEAMRAQNELTDRENGVKQAPFVGKTEAWLSLAIKRVISYAAQNGYDKVAFINGQQSADRYDLSNQVDQIRYVKQANGTFDVWASDSEGLALNDTVDKQGLTPEQIEDFVGKEIAEKIVAGVGRADAGDMVLEGVDLKIGGEGMLSFYDQVVPNTVNAVLKKLGGGKVEKIALTDIFTYEQLVAAGKATGRTQAELDAMSVVDRKSLVDAQLLKIHPAGQVSFTMTDAMRDNALGGLPMFSRSPADLSRQAGAVIKAVTVTSVKNKLIDHRDKLLMSLGRRQLKDLYGNLFPQWAKPNMMESYNTLAMKMDAEKNEAGAAADALTTRWAKLPKQVGDALAELMHDATRLQIDPRQKFVIGDIKTNYTELRARYEEVAKNAEAKSIFDDAAASYEKHYADVRAAVHDRIVRAMPGHPGQAAMLTRMDADFFHKIKGIYFPLSRFGDYLVQVNWRGIGPNPMTGQAREAVHFAETFAEAQELRKELLEKYPANKGYQVAEITRRAEYNAARDSVGRGFLQQMFNLFKTTGMDPSLQDAINQLYLTSLPDLSWAKHGIHRKGTPGFSQDARRAFAHHMFHGARYLAKLHYADQLTQELDDMQHYLTAHAQDAGYDPVKAQQLVDEMVKRHEIYMNPKTNALSTGLTSFGFVFFLGLSPASAMVNLSQTALVAYPILGGRYGYGKAGSALLAASKDAMRGHNDMSKVLTGDELLAYEGWVKSGLIDVTMAHDLAGVSQGEDSKLWGKMRPVMKAASFMFHHAEKFNRQATALAAYRLARGQGMDHDTAYARAVDDTYAGHFDYAAGNRPRIMQGNVARVVLLFKQYAQNMIYTFSRNAQLAFKGDKQAMKTISGLLVSHALAAGVLGLPLVGTLLAAASLLGSDDDEPWDAKIALRNMMADAFGNDTAEVMAHGLSRATPWDISSRVGLNQLLLPDVQEGLEGGRLAETYMVGLMGPIAGVVVNWGKGLHNIAEGQMQRGLEQMVPVALRGPMKSVRYYQEGVKDRSGIDILPETTAAEEAGQFLGLSPSRAREAQEGKSAIFKTDRALQNRRQDLMTTYAKHVMDQEDPTDALDAIGAFNQLHPNRMIAPLHLMQSIRVRMQHQAQAEQGIFLPNKRRDAREAGRFAEETP